jgi:hypothetical protein
VAVRLNVTKESSHVPLHKKDAVVSEGILAVGKVSEDAHSAVPLDRSESIESILISSTLPMNQISIRSPSMHPIYPGRLDLGQSHSSTVS